VAQQLKTRAEAISAVLKKQYPPTNTALHHDNPLQLLLATMLSAQCTDVQVNKVTPLLFARYRSAKDFARAAQHDVEVLVHSTGFFKNKARNIIACCRMLMERHHGEVPQTLDELVRLPGVGRKTANVVLGAWWGIPGMVVDTHVKRISRLLRLTQETDPVKIEYDLMKLVPQEDWNIFGMALILHGRAICIARRPQCARCPLALHCPSKKPVNSDR
jgi:endonuclease III